MITVHINSMLPFASIPTTGMMAEIVLHREVVLIPGSTVGLP